MSAVFFGPKLEAFEKKWFSNFIFNMPSSIANYNNPH